VLGAILLVGSLYYFIAEVRKPKVAIVTPSETGPVTIPAESRPPGDVTS
jgi:hypothetical protein